MTSSGYDDLGPRIDMGPSPEHQQYAPPPPTMEAPLPPRAKQKSGGSLLGVVSLVFSLAALGMGAWTIMAPPQVVPGPAPAMDVVPGGSPERVAKLEKDVGGLMLRLVTLEKELDALRSKSGSVNKLTELSAKLAALQSRLDSLEVSNKIGDMSAKKETRAEPEKPEPKPEPKQETEENTKSTRKKLVYTVQRGDTLFTVAQRYKVRMSDLKEWNKLGKGHILKVNEKLVIYK